MQAIAPVTSGNLLEPVQRMRYKLEIYDGAAWVNLSSLGGNDYLKSVSLSLGGAGMETAPIAGTWSAMIDNPLGIFHPQHPTSAYAGLLRVGREVRISVGAEYGGVDYYWQRLIGFMDAPRFDHGSKTVMISGMDYMKLLADAILYDSTEQAESGSGSGSSYVPGIVNGPTHWGGVAVFDSIATEGTVGAEIYDEADALEIGAHEANNVANWTDDAACTASSTADAGGGSTWVMLIEKDTDNIGYVTNANVGAMTADKTYQVSFKAIRSMGEAGTIQAWIYSGTSLIGYSDTVDSDAWVAEVFEFVATATTDIKMKFRCLGDSGTAFRVDQVSIKEVTAPLPYSVSYTLPDESNAAYYVILDGTPLYPGDPPEKRGWFNNYKSTIFRFADGADIPAGTDNLWVYYYTTQALDNIVADLMVISGLYADRATALADMDYTATGVSIEKVWFDSGTTALEAMRMLCERVNYRFWFAYDGKPNFQPAPTAGAIDFTFTEAGHLMGLADFQDIGVIRNRVVIEGAERAAYRSRDDRKMGNWKGEASDAASIAAYLEKTYSVKNHLFQDQASIDDMVAAVLAAFKDPKWYSDLSLFANPVPLELGDVIQWEMELEPTDAADTDSGSVTVTMLGIIRDIKITDAVAVYKCEVVDALESGSASASASASP